MSMRVGGGTKSEIAKANTILGYGRVVIFALDKKDLWKASLEGVPCMFFPHKYYSEDQNACLKLETFFRK